MATSPRRAGRRTNLALLVLAPIAFGTGWLAFATGTPWPAAVVTTAHAVAGLGLLVLVPWKQLIIRRSWQRTGSTAVKWSSLALAGFVLLSLLAGLVHAYFGPVTIDGITAMQVHVGAAIVAAPLFLAHLLTRRLRVRVTDLSRRNAVRLLAVAGAAGAAFLAAEGLAVVARLPGRQRRSTGSYQTGTDDPGAMPLTSWLFDAVPDIDMATWQLTVGTPEGTRVIGYRDLVAAGEDVRAVLDCTGGWYAAQTWRGTRLDRLLPAVPPDRTVLVVSTTGYDRRFPAAELSTLWLATHMAGRPLDSGHGAPVRLVAPGRRGFWWVKWVHRIEVVDGPSWWQPPFPLQ